MANAFCAIINGGTLMQPYIVDNITTTDGTVIVKNDPTILKRRVISSSCVRHGEKRCLQSVADQRKRQ